MTRFICLFLASAAVVICTSSVRGQDGFCMVNGTTTGGTGGTTVTVTNGTDFITQITAAGARIIQVQGVISVGRVTATANKTVIGLGTNATVYGNVNISDTTNVIVRNLRISYPGGDGLTIWNAQHVWVDHCTFFDCDDGSCDMSRGSAYVTVSWCKFIFPTQSAHQFTMIADGYVNGGVTNYGYYTLHHNWWSKGANQRMPASSYGRIHLYNNYFNCTNNSYCSNARNGTQFLSVSNYYAGVKSPLYADAGSTGLIRAYGNIYSGTSGNTPAPGTDTLGADLDPPPYTYTADSVTDVPAIVMAGAGAPGPDTMPIPPKFWDGGGTDNNLTSANNWSLNENPKVYDTLTFAGATRLTPNNNFTAASEFPAINFSNTAGAFVLGGNAIGLGIGITDDSTSAETINLNMDFTYGAHHYPTNRYFTVSPAAGSLVINGKISGGTSNYIFSLVKQGDGLLTLNGLVTYVGPVVLKGGLLKFSSLATNVAGSLGAGSLIAFDGGGLQWAPGNTADISARTVTINSGGATLDSGTNHIVFSSAIGNNGSGGLTKTGAGTITLNGNNTYSGPTLITQGTLALGAAGALPNSSQIILSNNAALDISGRSDGTLTLGGGKSLIGNGSVLGSVTVNSGSTLAPGFSTGSLVITNALTFQSGSTNIMQLDKLNGTNDLITGMASVSYSGRLVLTNISGTLTKGDTFKLFNAGSYNNSFSSITWPALDGNLNWTNKLAVDGTIAVISPVNTAPTNITFSVSGGNLIVAWPADHTGWTLQVQTNALNTGLGTNWVDVAGSAGTNRLVFPIDPANGSVFLRLTYP